MLSTEFGFYPSRCDLILSGLEIQTLADFESKVSLVSADPGVEGEWIYAPAREQISFGVPGRRVLPYASRVFGLPKTHKLIHTSTDPQRLTSLIWVFGFFVGMRLTDLEAGYLDAAALRPGTSNDVIWFADSLEKALLKADAFLGTHAGTPEVERAIRAVIHSYHLADLPLLLDFERFIHLGASSCKSPDRRGRGKRQTVSSLESG